MKKVILSFVCLLSFSAMADHFLYSVITFLGSNRGHYAQSKSIDKNIDGLVVQGCFITFYRHNSKALNKEPSNMKKSVENWSEEHSQINHDLFPWKASNGGLVGGGDHEHFELSKDIKINDLETALLDLGFSSFIVDDILMYFKKYEETL